MKNIIILILSVFCTIPCIAQKNNIWPYSKGVFYFNKTDSLGNITSYLHRTTLTYDTVGRQLSKLYEENSGQLDTNNYIIKNTDTTQYDINGRLLTRKFYIYAGFYDLNMGEDYHYFDSANSTGYIKYSYWSQNKAWLPESWKITYFDINKMDSVILQGTVGVFFQNISSKKINYYSNIKLDSSIYLKDDNGKMVFNSLEKYYYPYPDTVIKLTYNSTSTLFSTFKFGYDLQTGNFLKIERIYNSLHIVEKYQYYNNGQIRDYKSYEYDETKKMFLLTNSTRDVFDSYGTRVKSFVKYYENGSFKDGYLYLYYYSLRQPTANFSTINKCLGDSVNFTDESKDAQTYLWDFGDGQTSALKSPKHFYSKPGTYNVKLKVTANSGLKDSVIKQLVIYPQPEAGFTITRDTLQSSAYSYIFTPKDTTQKNYLWHFGDSSISSKSKIAKYTFPNAANYKVSLQVTNENNCFTAADTLLTVTSSIDELRTGHDLDFSVYPNPFSNELTISYNKLNDNFPLTIYITDVTGKEIMNITNPNELTGKQLLRIDASGINLKPGIYFIKLVSGNINTHKKAIFIK